MKKSPEARIRISIRKQRLTLKTGGKIVAEYRVSTSRFGLGSRSGSYKTPTGRFQIVQKIGEGLPIGTAFKSRRPVRMTKKLMQEDDLVMTRILWLDGLEERNANSRDRYIYIHGTNHEESIGVPDSHGCIRMRNTDVAELFDLVPEGTPVEIRP